MEEKKRGGETRRSDIKCATRCETRFQGGQKHRRRRDPLSRLVVLESGVIWDLQATSHSCPVGPLLGKPRARSKRAR